MKPEGIQWVINEQFPSKLICLIDYFFAICHSHPYLEVCTYNSV